MHNLRDYVTDNYKQIDDYQFGGGAGMVMMIEPIDKCITKLKSERDYNEVIYMTPDGATLNQKMANRVSMMENIIILCGHYKGVDQRVRDHVCRRCAHLVMQEAAGYCLKLDGGRDLLSLGGCSRATVGEGADG